jgi:hypothetical protein
MSQAVPRTTFCRNPLHAQAAAGRRLVLVFGMTANLDIESDIRSMDEPRASRTQPLVGHFGLPAVVDDLRENAELVANAVANGGNLERRQRIKVTGGETAETAVTESGLLFLIEKHVQIEPKFRHRLPGVVENAEIDQVVAQLWTDQELGRQVADRTAALVAVGARGLHPALQQAIAYRQGECLEAVTPGCHLRKARLRVNQSVQKGALERVYSESHALVVPAHQRHRCRPRMRLALPLLLLNHAHSSR